MGQGAGRQGQAAKHDVLKLALNFDPSSGGPGAQIIFEHEDMDRMLSLIAGGVPGTCRMNVDCATGPGSRNFSVTVKSGKSDMVFDVEQGAFELKVDNGKKPLAAKNTEGDTVFSQPRRYARGAQGATGSGACAP